MTKTVSSPTKRDRRYKDILPTLDGASIPINVIQEINPDYSHGAVRVFSKAEIDAYNKNMQQS